MEKPLAFLVGIKMSMSGNWESVSGALTCMSGALTCVSGGRGGGTMGRRPPLGGCPPPPIKGGGDLSPSHTLTWLSSFLLEKVLSTFSLVAFPFAKSDGLSFSELIHTSAAPLDHREEALGGCTCIRARIRCTCGVRVIVARRKFVYINKRV